jgi:glycosyltransferase involved in cell wall biosynthesis
VRRKGGRIPLVAHCLGTLRLAGTEKEVLSFLHYADPQRFGSVVLLPPGEGPLRDLLDAAGANVVDGPSSIAGRATLLRRLGVDLVHVLASRRDALAGRLAGALVVQKRNLPIRGYASRYVKLTLVDRLLTRLLCHGTVTVARALKHDLVTHGGFDPRRIAVVPNGIEAGLYRPGEGTVEALRARHDLPAPGSGPLLVGTVARLHPQKGLQYLLAAVPAVLERYPDTLFVIAGEGEEEQRLKQMARQRDLTEQQVRFLGFEADVPSLLSLLDLFVLSSLWEGMPFAILEAMAAGKAQVVTDVDGCRELVLQGETGLLVPPYQAADLAEGICRLLGNHELRRGMGEAARRRAEEEFSPRLSAARLEDVFQALLDGRDAATAGVEQGA